MVRIFLIISLFPNYVEIHFKMFDMRFYFTRYKTMTHNCNSDQWESSSHLQTSLRKSGEKAGKLFHSVRSAGFGWDNKFDCVVAPRFIYGKTTIAHASHNGLH